MPVLDRKIARVFEPLLHPARYRAAWGGRGSGKSHFFAEQLIEDALCQRGQLAVCIREVQKSLRESAHRLLVQKLRDMRLGEADGFKIFQDRIQTPGDGVIIFQGMQEHTAESIKSLEGFTRAWIEEAQTVSSSSLRLLRPTIRAEGSEIWASWNPRLKNDPIDVLLRQGNIPTGATVVRANWSDNPWFPTALAQERIDCMRDTPDEYEHIWEGGYVTATSGAYFAKHLALARQEKRVGLYNPDPLMTFHAFVDIGGTGAKSDAFVMWIVQFIGSEIRCVDYYEVQGQPFAAHLDWLLKNKYETFKTKIWLPHDGRAQDKVFAVSYESSFRQAGYNVVVVPNQGKGAAMQRIEAARRLFPSITFNAEKCEGGLDALGWYHEKIDEHRNIGLGPCHDWSSHGADAFGLMCATYRNQKPKWNKLEYKKVCIA